MSLLGGGECSSGGTRPRDKRFGGEYWSGSEDALAALVAMACEKEEDGGGGGGGPAHCLAYSLLLRNMNAGRKTGVCYALPFCYCS